MSPVTVHRQNDASDWLVVAASAIGIATSVICLYGMGVFIPALEAEFGWRRSEITGGLLIVSVVAVLGAPFVGLLIDKVGSRRVALSGISLYCASVIALGTVSGSVWNWWLVWTGIALGGLLIAPTVWMKAIAIRFDKHRGIALGLALCGASLTLATVPSIAHFLISNYGWRAAFTILGIVPALIALPMILLFVKGRADAHSDAIAPPTLLCGLSISDGLRSKHFHRIALAGFSFTVAIIGLVVHFVPILTGLGVSPARGAAIAGGLGVGSIVGRIGSGLLIDRFDGPSVGAIGFTLPVLGCLMLLGSGGSEAWAVAVAIVIGGSLGAEIDVLSYLASRYFGLRHYGVLFGTIAGLLTLGSGVGSALAAGVHDWFGTYDPFIWATIPLFGMGAVLIKSLGAYPVFDVDESSRLPGDR